MRKGVKISLAVALSLIVTGMAAIALGGAIMGFDFTKMDTTTYIKRSETVEESFNEIEIDCTAADVTVLPASDGVCRVESRLNKDIEYSVAVENGKLKVQYGPFEWYQHFGIHFLKNVYITVYLPEAQYGSLQLNLRSGDALLENMQIEKTKIDNCSGDVQVKNLKGELLSVETTSGDIGVCYTEVAGDLSVKTTSGDVKIQSTNVLSLLAHAVSGDVEIEDMLAKENITLESTSGDVEFSRMDAKTLKIETTSGDVEGTLLSVKCFICDSTSGDVYTPDSDSNAGKCIVHTTSGDIQIRVIS